MRRNAFVTVGSLLVVLSPVVARAGDGPVALQTAAASCRDGSTNIYVSCGNGTVTDNRTGLVWLANANCIGAVDWHTAMEFVAGLSDGTSFAAADDCGLSDGSSPGEWRLPTAEEWATMIADAYALGCHYTGTGGPAITNDAGTACWGTGPSSFSYVQSDIYWSATTIASGVGSAHFADLNIGYATGYQPKTNLYYVWPVRGGQ